MPKRKNSKPNEPTGMRVEYVALGDIRVAPRNPKRHAGDVLAASFDRFGYVQPMVRDERTGALVAGHGRLEQLQKAKALGERPPARIELRSDGEWLVPVLAGVEFVDDVEAEAYLLTDNKSGELGGYDPALLAEMVRDMSADGIDRAQQLGWSDAELASLRAYNPSLPVSVPVTGVAPAHSNAAVAPASTDHVVFKFGGYTGLVPRAVFDAFETKLNEMRASTGEPMLGDVLARWLGV